MSRFVLAGHSHTYAMGLPSASVDAIPNIVEIVPDMMGLIGPWPRNQGYWDTLATVAASNGCSVALSFLGNEHLAHFLIEDQPFDFVRSAAPDEPLLADVDLVPESLIRELFDAHRLELPKILKQLSDAGVRTFLLGTPPPKGDLLELLALEPFFVDRLKSIGLSLTTARLCPTSVQLKLWKLLQTMLADAADQQGARFVPYPLELISVEGFLKREYWNNDVTHANLEAGTLFRKKLLTLEREAV